MTNLRASLDKGTGASALPSGALDALPHNGAVITLLSVCGISHREAYADVFVSRLPHKWARY